MHRYGPKSAVSPTVGDPCGVCGEPLLVGDYTTLVRLNHATKYGDDAVEAHWDCGRSLGKEDS